MTTLLSLRWASSPAAFQAIYQTSEGSGLTAPKCILAPEQANCRKKHVAPRSKCSPEVLARGGIPRVSSTNGCAGSSTLAATIACPPDMNENASAMRVKVAYDRVPQTLVRMQDVSNRALTWRANRVQVD